MKKGVGSWPCVDDVQDKHDDENLFCPHAGDCLDSLDTFLFVAGLGVWFLVVGLMVGVDLVLFHVGGISVWLRDKARCRRVGDLRCHFELLLGFVGQRKGSWPSTRTTARLEVFRMWHRMLVKVEKASRYTWRRRVSINYIDRQAAQRKLFS